MAKSARGEAASKTANMTVRVVLAGTLPIMFDRYPGDNNTKLDWEKKIYLKPGSNVLVLPTTNIQAALSSINTMSFPKRVLASKTYTKACQACLSFVRLHSGDDEHPGDVPFYRDGKPIEVGAFDQSKDPKSGIYKAMHVARLPKGVPNPKVRPVLPLPWELRFTLFYIANTEVSLADVKNLLVKGGQTLGLGTYRGAYGLFDVAGWEEA